MSSNLSKIVVTTIIVLTGWILIDYYLLPGPVSIIQALSFAIVFGVTYAIAVKITSGIGPDRQD